MVINLGYSFDNFQNEEGMHETLQGTCGDSEGEKSRNRRGSYEVEVNFVSAGQRHIIFVENMAHCRCVERLVQ